MNPTFALHFLIFQNMETNIQLTIKLAKIDWFSLSFSYRLVSNRNVSSMDFDRSNSQDKRSFNDGVRNFIDKVIV
jgi:hypothetical protein